MVPKPVPTPCPPSSDVNSLLFEKNQIADGFMELHRSESAKNVRMAAPLAISA